MKNFLFCCLFGFSSLASAQVEIATSQVKAAKSDRASEIEIILDEIILTQKQVNPNKNLDQIYSELVEKIKAPPKSSEAEQIENIFSKKRLQQLMGGVDSGGGNTAHGKLLDFYEASDAIAMTFGALRETALFQAKLHQRFRFLNHYFENFESDLFLASEKIIWYLDRKVVWSAGRKSVTSASQSEIWSSSGKLLASRRGDEVRIFVHPTSTDLELSDTILQMIILSHLSNHAPAADALEVSRKFSNWFLYSETASHERSNPINLGLEIFGVDFHFGPQSLKDIFASLKLPKTRGDILQKSLSDLGEQFATSQTHSEILTRILPFDSSCKIRPVLYDRVSFDLADGAKFFQYARENFQKDDSTMMRAETTALYHFYEQHMRYLAKRYSEKIKKGSLSLEEIRDLRRFCLENRPAQISLIYLGSKKLNDDFYTLSLQKQFQPILLKNLSGLRFRSPSDPGE